jgi:hypothetical protein
MTQAERAILATSQARDLCLSLRRAFAGPRALERLRAGEAAQLTLDEFRLALGLAWAAGDTGLMRRAFEGRASTAPEPDGVLGALREACGAGS